jgi:hypothetical protein
MLIYGGDDPQHFYRPLFLPGKCKSLPAQRFHWWARFGPVIFAGLAAWAFLRALDFGLWVNR